MKVKNTLEGDSPENPLAPITKVLAIEFITKFTNEYKDGNAVQIPTAWLFECGILESLAINGVTGIRFYTAINKDKFPGLNGPITFIMVAAKKDANGECTDFEDETIYEFSHMCPQVCSVGVIGSFTEKTMPFIIPKSFYFPLSFFEKTFQVYSNSTGVRLYSEIVNDRLALTMRAVEKIDLDFNDLPALTYPDNYEVCENGAIGCCAINSSLYIV